MVVIVVVTDMAYLSKRFCIRDKEWICTGRIRCYQLTLIGKYRSIDWNSEGKEIELIIFGYMIDVRNDEKHVVIEKSRNHFFRRRNVCTILIFSH